MTSRVDAQPDPPPVSSWPAVFGLAVLAVVGLVLLLWAGDLGCFGCGGLTLGTGADPAAVQDTQEQLLTWLISGTVVAVISGQLAVVAWKRWSEG